MMYNIYNFRLVLMIIISAVLFITEGTDYLLDGLFYQGPKYPSGAYGDPVLIPCVTSIDDNTGVLVSARSNINGGYKTLTSVWSYSFKNLTWNKLADFPAKIKGLSCTRAKLASGKDVILTAGNALTLALIKT